MKKNLLFTAGVAVVLLSILVSLPARRAHGQDGVAATTSDFIAPLVFQGAGPSRAEIDGIVVQYRGALGGDNNGTKGPQDEGHREINWDGGNPAVVSTTLSPNPFDGFKIRGALFTTPDGTGFVQATPSGLADATVFNNPTYTTSFAPFSDSRLFSAIGSNITDVDFFLPGGGNVPALVKGFGAVFTDVDLPDGSGPAEKHGNRKSSTLIEYFGVNGELLFSSFVPAAPGDRGQSFLGIVFPDRRIAHVRIISGNVAPGPDDGGKLDVVMMDDFLFGEPK